MHFASSPLRTKVRTSGLLRIGAAILLASALSGCMTAQSTTSSADANLSNANASLNTGTSPTIAFESVDGPPPHLFDRLVEILDSEAKLRQVSVVSHKDPAAYRIRTYLAAIVVGKQTSIAWVWDVYDRNQNRSIRLRGEEKTGKTGHDAWALADDMILRRIAQAGFTGLKEITGETAPAPDASPAAEPALAAPAQSSPAVARSKTLRQVANVSPNVAAQ